MEAVRGPGQIGGAEYEDRHKGVHLSADVSRSRSPRPGPERRLWMKFHKRNISSTCLQERFRRSGPWSVPKFFCFHSFPHRLCTSYAGYCTGYPHPFRHAGFEAEPKAASVAGYLFFGACGGFQKGRRDCTGRTAATAGTADVENLWIVGITPTEARAPAGSAGLSDPAGKPGQVAERSFCGAAPLAGWLATGHFRSPVHSGGRQLCQ